jgi:hypothetical protein
MADLTPIQRDLQLLEVDLRRLETEYNMFFANRLPRPPWETRKRVETVLRRWDGVHISSTADRFRFGSLQARFTTFTELWDRNLRAREEGRSGTLVKPESIAAPRETVPAERVLCVETLSNPQSETQKLDTLYRSLMEARRERGEETVPFPKFAELVRGQMARLQAHGSPSAAFRVGLKDGKVTFSVRGLKGDEPGGEI